MSLANFHRNAADVDQNPRNYALSPAHAFTTPASVRWLAAHANALMSPAYVLLGPPIAAHLLFAAALRVYKGIPYCRFLYYTNYNTMSTAPLEAASTTDESLPILIFDHPGADIILRSQDSHHLRVPRIYIISSSPILGELIRKTSSSLNDMNPAASLPVVQLSESGEMLHCLLTFIFPVTPCLPSTPEEIMKLLSIAQKYQMDSVLSHIRDRTARHYPLPTCLEPSLRIYSLAQKYGLRPEALHAARAIFLNHSMTIEDLENMLDIMSCASLYELLKYHERVRAFLGTDLAIFRMSRARGTITGLRCTELSLSQIPSWLYLYIKSIGKNPGLFDSAEFNIAMARHIKDKANEPGCECASIPSKTIRNFSEALATVVYGSFKKVGVVDIPSRLL